MLTARTMSKLQGDSREMKTRIARAFLTVGEKCHLHITSLSSFLRYVGTEFYYEGKEILRIVRYITYILCPRLRYRIMVSVDIRSFQCSTFYNEDI